MQSSQNSSSSLCICSEIVTSLTNCRWLTAVTQVQCNKSCCVFRVYPGTFLLLGCNPASLGKWLQTHRNYVQPWLTMWVNQGKLLFTSVLIIIEISRVLCSSGIDWKYSLINDVVCIWSALLPRSLLCHASKIRFCFKEQSCISIECKWIRQVL